MGVSDSGIISRLPSGVLLVVSTGEMREAFLGDERRVSLDGEVILRLLVGDSGIIGSESFAESTVRTMPSVFAKSLGLRQEACWATFSDRSLLRSS